MAILLHLETATTVCSVSLSVDGQLQAIEELNDGFTHAENLVSFCNSVLKKSNFSFTDLHAVAVSKGPGSYTGLRIGVSAAKGFCYALNIPLIAINTLQHIAMQISSLHENENALFCPMLDARRMEVYCALYDINNKEVRKTAAEIIDENSFSEELKNNQIYFFGDGADKCKTTLEKNVNAIFIDNIFPSSKNMIALAEKKYNAQDFENTAYFEPFYLKDFLAGK